MSVLNIASARYQVQVIPINADHEVFSIFPGLDLQGDILGLRIRFLQKLSQFAVVTKASRSRCLRKGAYGGQ